MCFFMFIFMSLCYFYIYCINYFIISLSYFKILVYCVIWISIHELNCLLVPSYTRGDINYDFDTDTLFVSSRRQVAYDESVNFTSSSEFIWSALKFNYRFHLKIRYRNLRSEIVDGYIYKNIFRPNFKPRITVIVIINTLSIINLPFKIITTFMYFIYIVWGLVLQYRKKNQSKITKLRLHELFILFPFFKLILPSIFFSYVIAKGPTFYSEDLANPNSNKNNFYRIYKLKHVVWLFITFDLFVKPYYTAFLRVQTLVHLNSHIQSFYVVTTSMPRLYTVYDTKYKKLPLFKKRTNPNSIWTKISLCIFFILTEHVRTTAIFLFCINPFGKWEVRSQDFLNNTRKVSEDLDDVLWHIFGHYSTILLLPIYTMGMHRMGQNPEFNLCTDPSLFHNPSKGVNTDSISRPAIIINSKNEVYTCLPSWNWYYHGLNFNVLVVETFIKLDWRYLFKDTNKAENKWLNRT